jgi:hypothetical protein
MGEPPRSSGLRPLCLASAAETGDPGVPAMTQSARDSGAAGSRPYTDGVDIFIVADMSCGVDRS